MRQPGIEPGSIAWKATMLTLACTKPYYFDVADDSRVCYVEKDFLSKVICKKPHDEVHCYIMTNQSKASLIPQESCS